MYNVNRTVHSHSVFMYIFTVIYPNQCVLYTTTWNLINVVRESKNLTLTLPYSKTVHIYMYIFLWRHKIFVLFVYYSGTCLHLIKQMFFFWVIDWSADRWEDSTNCWKHVLCACIRICEWKWNICTRRISFTFSDCFYNFKW